MFKLIQFLFQYLLVPVAEQTDFNSEDRFSRVAAELLIVHQSI